MIKIEDYKDCYKGFCKKVTSTLGRVVQHGSFIYFDNEFDAAAFQIYIHDFKQGEIAAHKETNEYIKSTALKNGIHL